MPIPRHAASAALVILAFVTPASASDTADGLSAAADALPVTRDDGVKVRALIGDTIRVEVDQETITLRSGDLVRYRGQIYRAQPIDNHLLMIGAEGQDPVVLPVRQQEAVDEP